MEAQIKIRPDRVKGAIVVLLAFAFLSPLFGNARLTRHASPTSDAIASSGDRVPTPPADVPHPCRYVISSWVHYQDKSDDQDAQERLTEAINRLLPDPNIVRAFTQKVWQSVREAADKREKKNPLDHYDLVGVTETLTPDTGKMTIEIYVHSVPAIPGHDFRLGSDTPVRIEGCTLPARNSKGERSCRNFEIGDIAEKIKAHDKEHDQGKYATH